MSRIVTIHVAKTTLSQLVAQAEAGEEIVIARNKTPVAKLTALAAPRPERSFGAMRGKAAVGPAFFEPLSEDELGRWE